MSTSSGAEVLEPLHEVYGVDVSDDALRKAVAEHNEVCRILTEIGQFRKEETRASRAMSTTSSTS